MSNKVQFGINNVYVSKITVAGGVTSYADPVAIAGAVSLTATPENEEIKFEADNDPNYFAKFANKGYGIEMAMAIIPDQFKIDYLGYKRDANGVVLEDVTASGADFALLFEVQGDTEAVRFAYYKCTAGRPTLAPKTGSTPEAQTIPITVGKPVDSNNSTASLSASANPTVFANWFTAVQSFSDAALSSLAITGLTLSPLFAADKNNYTAATTTATNKITATAAAGSTATIKLNGSSHTSGQEATWSEGLNTVVVTVAKGIMKTYYEVKVTKTGA